VSYAVVVVIGLNGKFQDFIIGAVGKSERANIVSKPRFIKVYVCCLSRSENVIIWL